MTYDELLAKIAKEFSISKFDSTLRSVAELHAPEGSPTQQCAHCHYEYPCPTIREIARGLK